MWEMSMVGSSESTVARSIATLETYLLGRYSFVMIAFLSMTRISINIITTSASINISINISIKPIISVSISVSSSAWQWSSPSGRTRQSKETTICHDRFHFLLRISINIITTITVIIITISMVIPTRQNWTIEGDNNRCSPQGQAYTTTLKLTGLFHSDDHFKFDIWPKLMMVLLMILCCQDLKRGIVTIISNWLCGQKWWWQCSRLWWEISWWCPTSDPPLVVKRGTSLVTMGSASEWRRDVIRLYHPVIMSSCHLQLVDWTVHIFSQRPDCLDKSELCHPRPILPTTTNHNQQLPTTINHNQPQSTTTTTINYYQP